MTTKEKATIFLDIDGVLCVYPGSHYNYRVNPNNNVSAFACANLKGILDATDARLVVSSSWRLFPEFLSDLIKQLGTHGIKRNLVVGVTEDLSQTPGIKDHCHLRWTEINDYIKKHKLTNYVILDDFSLEQYTDKRFVKTHMHTGLTEELRDLAIAVLTA